MRKHILYTMILSAGLSITGCSDQFLQDMRPYDKYTPELVFGNDQNIDAYIGNIYYNYFYGIGQPTRTYGLVGTWTDNTAYTEEQWGINKFFDATQEIYRANDANGYFGQTLSGTVNNNPYTRIRSCNEVIEGVEKYGANLSEEAKKRALGQAYFFRALQLFDLVRVYGPVPIVEVVLDASDREGAQNYKRESVEECIKHILDDLKNAIANLPTLKEWGGDNAVGRLTKEAAMAYKSRVLLVFASPIFNSDWDNPNNQRWQDALTASIEAKTFLDAEGYGKGIENVKDWNEMFYTNDNKHRSEYIMVKVLSNSTNKNEDHSTWQKGIRPKTMGGSGNGMQVPMGMLEIFPMADGSMATQENGYDEFLFFKNRDPRFYYTFAFAGQKWGYDKDEDAVLWNYRWDDAQNNHYYFGSMTGSSPAIVRKMSDPEVNSNNTYQQDGTDLPEYRYAELVLNLAECYAATGNVTEAIKLIGEIRKRVGIPAANNYGLGNISDKNEVIKACLHERQIELAYEGKRYWDLWRWMLYNDDASDNNTTCAALGIEPMNGTHRIGKYLQVKGGATYTKDDPLKDKISDFVPVDIDDIDNLQSELVRLGEFWKDNFEFEDTETPVDADKNNQQAEISWRQNYYLSGLPYNVLNMNPWLEQSKGWTDTNENYGTLDPRK